MIRKFYDAAMTETATAAPTPSIATLMAQHGVRNETENPVAQPFELPKQETKEEPSQPAATPGETPTEPVQTAASETPSQTAEVKTEPTPQKAEEQPKPMTLQEVLKKESPKAILEALGFDENVVSLAGKLKENPKMQAFFNHWQNKGDVKEYLSAMTTDFKTMPAEEVMRHQLRKEYPTASDRAIDILYKREVVDKYNLDSALTEEKEDGVELLNAIADRHRADFIKSQEDFILPQPPEPKADNSEQELAQQRQQEIEAYRSSVSNSDYVKNIISTKQFTIGEGDEKFNFQIDPKELTEVLFNDEKWGEKMFVSQNGKLIPKTEHQMLVALVATYGESFLKEYAKHMKSLGGNAAIAPIDNASPVNPVTATKPDTTPLSIAAGMAKHGQLR